MLLIYTKNTKKSKNVRSNLFPWALNKNFDESTIFVLNTGYLHYGYILPSYNTYFECV